MVITTGSLQRSQSAKYRIKIQGRQRMGWSDWLDDLEIYTDQDADGHTFTTLTGVVKDQTGLHGLLNRIRDLSIPLIAVQLVQTISLEKE